MTTLNLVKTDSELQAIIEATYADFIEKNNLTQLAFYNDTNLPYSEFAIDFDPANYQDWVEAHLVERPVLASIVFNENYARCNLDGLPQAIRPPVPPAPTKAPVMNNY